MFLIRSWMGVCLITEIRDRGKDKAYYNGSATLLEGNTMNNELIHGLLMNRRFFVTKNPPPAPVTGVGAGGSYDGFVTKIKTLSETMFL
jgi:hypothetical protein